MKTRLWLVALLHAGAAAVAAPARPPQTMEQVRRDVEATAHALQEAEAAPVLELLEYTEKTTRLSAARVWAVKQALTVLEQRLARAVSRARLGAGLAQLEQRLQPRPLEGPLTAGHFQALVGRAREEASSQPRVLAALEAVEQARAAQERAAGALEALRTEVAARREALRGARGSRAGQRALVAALRARVRAERREAARLQRELGRTGRVLARHAAALRARPELRGFAALRGRLPMPVEGPIEAAFGPVVDPRFKTITLHQGVDIRAPQGSPVRAVAAGRVVHAGWLRGYGNVLIVDHGGGFHTLMAHLDAFRCEVGQPVKAGQEVATVGEGGPPGSSALYFEVRREGEALDPEAWLRVPEGPSARASSARAAQLRRTSRGARRR